jgi:hypothetical protein
VEEFWNESYLKPDASVVLNLNPYFVLEEGPDPKIAKDQLHRAASLCFASVRMASSLRNQTLKPDIFKGKPLCMDQFKALFGSSRQPTLNDSDDVHVYNDSSHGAFLCTENYFYLQSIVALIVPSLFLFFHLLFQSSSCAGINFTIFQPFGLILASSQSMKRIVSVVIKTFRLKKSA